ncbi:hypothetical protein CTAYLR_002003 [Chrysophaeum taylorii]|uniref:Calmodulin n=1 Tax=Chrysophaeum taylorii TaxID=2483200 RepID=A0AAD7XI58_9STRA|nr:hypothetical protein CTAYLR_002003 [Chrysophaeum taylorii]
MFRTRSNSRRSSHAKRVVKFSTDVKPRRLEPDEIDELREAFAAFDEDGDGTLQREELATVMRSLGQEAAPEDLEKIYASADEDGSGCICFDEFVALMAKFLPAAGDEGELQEAFEVFDRESAGGISADDLERTVASVGLDLTAHQLRDMMTWADRDGNGVVDFDEFKHIWAPLEGSPLVDEISSPAS